MCFACIECSVFTGNDDYRMEVYFKPSYHYSNVNYLSSAWII